MIARGTRWSGCWPRFLNDERGFVVSTELVLIATLCVLGLVTALSCVRDAVTGELNDVAEAIGSLNQSYAYSGKHGCISPKCGVSAYTRGSSFTDLQDEGPAPELDAGPAPAVIPVTPQPNLPAPAPCPPAAVPVPVAEPLPACPPTVVSAATPCYPTAAPCGGCEPVPSSVISCAPLTCSPAPCADPCGGCRASTSGCGPVYATPTCGGALPCGPAGHFPIDSWAAPCSAAPCGASPVCSPAPVWHPAPISHPAPVWQAPAASLCIPDCGGASHDAAYGWDGPAWGAGCGAVRGRPRIRGGRCGL